MAAGNEPTTQFENNGNWQPSDNDLFAGEVHDELSEREVFAGDEDFFKRLNSADKSHQRSRSYSNGGQQELKAVLHFSFIRKIIGLGIVTTALTMFFVIFVFPSKTKPVKDINSLNILHSASPVETPVITTEIHLSETSDPKIEIAKPSESIDHEPVEKLKEPLSLKYAEGLYLSQDYYKAYESFEQLRQNITEPTKSGGIDEELLKDFLQLKKGLCKKKISDIDEAERLFKTVLLSKSPVVRVFANYHLCFIELSKGEFFSSRTRAYQALALIDAVEMDRDWAALLKRDCQFAAAESVTRNYLSSCDADKNLPAALWVLDTASQDPFSNLDETQIRSLLNSGSSELNKAILSPQISKIESHDNKISWSVVSSGASIEELLLRFCSNAKLDVHWFTSNKSILERTEKDVLNRPVTLCFTKTAPVQLVSIAAGCTGLTALLDENNSINIYNTEHYTSLSQHLELLSSEAISLWHEFILMFHQDEFMPNAHFAAALLQAQRGQAGEAMAEFKIVANRFPQTALAPYALLYSSKLKTKLLDHTGTREDLKELVEQYPDSEITADASLSLAEATMKAQLFDEAARLYSKVYNIGFSPESKKISSFGAAKCFYEKKDYRAADVWINRFIGLAGSEETNLYQAYFILGKCNMALGDVRHACEAFQKAMLGDLSKDEYLDMVTSLVEGDLQQGYFLEALAVLEEAKKLGVHGKRIC